MTKKLLAVFASVLLISAVGCASAPVADDEAADAAVIDEEVATDEAAEADMEEEAEMAEDDMEVEVEAEASAE